MGDVEGRFLDVLARHLPMPSSMANSPEAWAKDYISRLDSFPDEVLEAAANRILDDAKSRRFPLPGECTIACKDALNDLEFKRRMRPNNTAEIKNVPLGQRDPACSDVRQKLANDLIRCPLGFRASEEGWIARLWDFCRDAGRLPNQNEVEAIVAKHKVAEKDFEDMKQGGRAPSFVLRARKAIIARRESLSDIVRNVA
jgi:hypothetical protein